jgi:hypothetical protein
MDNVQKHNICVNVPLSQTFKSLNAWVLVTMQIMFPVNREMIGGDQFFSSFLVSQFSFHIMSNSLQ